LGGMGVGFAYIVPISTCIQWFPERKGLVTGVAVAGFGGGAALISQGANYLIDKIGVSPFSTFRLLGIVYLLLIFTGACFMRTPSASSTDKDASLPLKSFLTTRSFWLLYIAMFSGLAAGFGVNGNLKDLSPSATTTAGVAAVSLFAVANAFGRVSWGALFDRFKGNSVLKVNLCAQAVTLLIGLPLLKSGTGLQIFALLAGFNYGGILVIYASTVAREWGANRVARIYPWVFSSNIPASISPFLVGFGFDRTGSFALPLIAISLVMFAGCALFHQHST